jgi:hypothetical protein
MNLGFTDRPIVPHNLISSQESPVSLPKFQMAPRLQDKILMSSGSKKGTRYTILFYPKRPGKKIPSNFPNEAPTERNACLQGIFTYLFV